MSSSNFDETETLRKIYQELKHKVRLLLSIIPEVEANKNSPLVDAPIRTAGGLIQGIIDTANTEKESIYKQAIVEVAVWLAGAFQKEYLFGQKNTHPTPIFVVKKAGEALHALIHRDLRRRQFSTGEAEIFRNFKNLTAKLPEPVKQGESKDDKSKPRLQDNLLKSS